MKNHRLNERQSRFAQTHYGVLEDFLRKRGLPFEEYYDAVVFEYLEAVKRYDEILALRRETFESVAERIMLMALREHFEQSDRLQEQKDLFEAVYPYSHRYGDMVPDKTVNVCEQVCRRYADTPKKKYRLSYIRTPKNVSCIVVKGVSVMR